MGAWGTGIFSNDTSRDVREDFAKHVGDGLPLDEVVEKILDEYCFDDRLDPDNNDVWLGLAAAQHASGHVTPEVMKVALEITESPSEYERWAPQDVPKRRSALTKLREKLLTEPRPPKRFRKRTYRTTDRVAGDHQLYIEGSARLLLRVVGTVKDSKGEYPLYTVLEWNGGEDELQNAAALDPIPANNPAMLGWKYFQFCVPRPLPKTSELKLLQAKSESIDPIFATWGFSSMAWPELLPYVRTAAERVPPTI
ncbi:hypothetical protein SAMN04488693_11195 [Arthrobacter subterraneus]|uniref:DUF4259 domain-containing protein n=1 Tax=Arthrobacter subterraneus TaxID=335973 RepID=A0A1G8KMA5_9MICC|nr:DUF4259 domain-containing protein [Arthrobacter subterraneus]SDI44571.1 hypothetical protein SAMN04488693_11195 [Arthrobacter subterraneus]